MARILTHDDDLSLDLRRSQTSDRRVWVGRQLRTQRLSKPLSQLGARGVVVPTAPSGSQGAVVKLWHTKASTTGAHATYLSRGKGLDGTDAPLFGREVDGFTERARADTHQIRGMVSLDAGDTGNFVGFIRRLVEQVERDVQAPLDWVGAIHYDTAHVHAHLILRGQDLNGRELYFTKHYWSYGLQRRAQALATADLGKVAQPSLTNVHDLWASIRQQLTRAQEMSHGRSA